MSFEERITIDSEICMGKPCIKGRRLTVEFILELLASKWSYEEIQKQYELQIEDIMAALAFAKRVIAEEKYYSLPHSEVEVEQ